MTCRIKSDNAEKDIETERGAPTPYGCKRKFGIQKPLSMSRGTRVAAV